MDQETVEETTVTHSPSGNVQKQTVVRSGRFSDFFVSKTNQVIFSIVGIINLLLLLRILFRLFGANRVGFVDAIYSITQPFVSPFIGIFPAPAVGDAYFDIAAFVAIIAYVVIGAILAAVVDMFSTKTA